MSRYYIAGAMSGEEDNGFGAMDAADAYLQALGHETVNPASLDRLVGLGPDSEITPQIWQDAMRRDIYELVLCDGIALLPTWERSRGARLERYVAEQIGLAVYHVVPWASFKPEVPAVIVGLSGYAQSGKDTSGAMMAELAGFERIAFADALKTVALAADPLVERHTATGKGIDSLSTVVRLHDWEYAKRNCPTSRVFLQHLGHAVREHVDPLAWVNAALNKAKPGGRYAITDVRYPNEAEAIKARGGYVVRVERPGTGPANAHVSETALDGWDFDAVLRNTGSLDDLKARVRLFLQTL